MMKTEARLALSLRQRRFEWALARDEQTRTAARLVAGKTHDLLNLLQILRLATPVLVHHCDARGREIVSDMERAAEDSFRSFTELMAVARPADLVVRGAPVAPAVGAAVASLRGALALEARIDVPPAAATRCTAEELEHLVIGLALDAAEVPATVMLAVREREISGARWIELVRGCAAVSPGDRFELRVIEAIARRARGEVSTSARRGGGEELIVALPEVA